MREKNFIMLHLKNFLINIKLICILLLMKEKLLLLNDLTVH